MTRKETFNEFVFPWQHSDWQLPQGVTTPPVSKKRMQQLQASSTCTHVNTSVSPLLSMYLGRTGTRDVFSINRDVWGEGKESG